MNNFLKFSCILFLLINISCTNTRIVLEGTKKIIQKKNNPIERKSISKSAFTLGHYKVGKPYTISGIEYIPRLVSSYDEIGIASWYGPK